MLEQPEHKQKKVIMITIIVRANTYLILTVFQALFLILYITLTQSSKQRCEVCTYS